MWEERTDTMADKPPLNAPLPGPCDPRQLDGVLEHVRQALVGLEFGEVSIIVQDGVVIQVERIERRRFRRGERRKR